jgi:hypothetical protein
MSPDASDWEDNAPSIRREPTFRSRLSILFVALVFGAVAALSVVGFLFNLTIHYPGTDRPVIAVDPLWMLGHDVRALGLGYLTYKLWRYQATIKHERGDSKGAEEFIAVHDAAWRAGAIVLATLLVYAVAYVVFGGPRI